MRLLAKSNPPEGLREHTEEVLKRIGQICHHASIDLSKEDWDLLKRAAYLHDLGKADPDFQRAVRGEGKGKVVPHNYLSLAFLREDEIKNTMEVRSLKAPLPLLVAFHHWRDIPDSTTLKKAYAGLRNNLGILKQEMGKPFTLVDIHLWIRVIEKAVQGFKKRLENEGPLNLENRIERRFVILLGLLMRADHSASAHVDAELPPLNKRSKTYEYLQNKVGKTADKLWQTRVLSRIGDGSCVVVAPTGMGKTELALLWAGKSKLIYTLPMRTSTNAMFSRLSRIFGPGNVGLLHSSAIGYMLQTSRLTDDAFHHYQTARQLAHNVIVSTADQVFTSVLRYPGHEKVFATLSYSAVVVDELQSYSPQTMAVIVRGLQDVRALGGRFLVITATFPPFLKGYLKAPIHREVPDLTKHRLKVIEEDLLNVDPSLVKEALGEGKRVLVVLNTVRRAQEFYERLRDIGLKPLLLHSRFTLRDRRLKERAVLKGENRLLIATQVVEVSLDIDYDVLLTDLSPADVLVQRMGRVFRRYKTEGNFAPDYPNVLVFSPPSYGDISGNGKVYERGLLKLTMDNLNEGPLSERDKHCLISAVYSTDALRFTRYLRNFEEAYKVMEGISLSRREAQSIFRDISSVEVLPEDALNWPVGDGWVQRKLSLSPDLSLSDALKGATTSDRHQKVLWIQLIQEFMVPVPAYWLKERWKLLRDTVPSLPPHLGSVPVVPLEYDPDIGAGDVKEEDTFL